MRIHVLTTGGYKNTIGFSMSWLDMDGPDEDQTDARGVTETIRLLPPLFRIMSASLSGNIPN